MERIRIAHYSKEGWVLLMRATRSKFSPGEIGGMWDLWLTDADSPNWWLFVQVGPHSMKKAKLRECRAWLDKYGIETEAVIFRLDLYQKKRGRIEWESVIL